VEEGMSADAPQVIAALERSVSSRRRERAKSAVDARTIGWLAAMVLVLHASGMVFGVLNVDEVDFLLIARSMLLGGVPFVDAVDIKPPLTYVAFLPSAIFGLEIWPMRLVAVAWVMATALILKRAAQRWTGRKDVGWAAAFLSVLANIVDVPSVTTEMLMNLPAALALDAFIRSEDSGEWKDDLLAGFWVGIATLFRHQAGILLAAFAIGLIISWARRERGMQIGRHLRLALGFAAPWVLTTLVFLALGELGAFYEWVIERNVFYASSSPFSMARMLQAIAVCVVLGAPLLWVLAVKEGIEGSRALRTLGLGAAKPIHPPTRADRVRTVLVLALLLTWIPVSLGGRFYEHYFIQFAPPLALLAAPQLIALGDRWSGASAWLRRAVILGLLIPPLGYLGFTLERGLAGRYPAQEAKSIEIAAWIRGHTSPDDRVFVWGHYSPIYYLADRMPGTRYLHTAPHMGDFDPQHLDASFDAAIHRSDRDVLRTIADLETRKPTIVVDTAPADIHAWSKIPLAKFPDLDRYVRDHYGLVAHPGGADVYRRVR
jgi:4-amino-4-deoxy-L-arabinose transferase-like glycosyltransferase